MKLTEFSEKRKNNTKKDLELILKDLVNENERLKKIKSPLADYPLFLKHIEEIKYLISTKK